MIQLGEIEPETYNFSEVAKKINISELGRNNMMEVLREVGVLDSHNMPAKEYINAGYFKIRNKYVFDRYYTATTVRGEHGVEFIRKQINNYLKTCYNA